MSNPHCCFTNADDTALQANGNNNGDDDEEENDELGGMFRRKKMADSRGSGSFRKGNVQASTDIDALDTAKSVRDTIRDWTLDLVSVLHMYIYIYIN